MSFDSTFNLQKSKEALLSKISALNDRNTKITDFLSSLNNTNDPQLEPIKIEKDSNDRTIAGFNSINEEIDVLMNLSSKNKYKLFKFWKLTTLTKNDYIALVCYNHAQMLADPLIERILQKRRYIGDQCPRMVSEALSKYCICYFDYRLIFS